LTIAVNGQRRVREKLGTVRENGCGRFDTADMLLLYRLPFPVLFPGKGAFPITHLPPMPALHGDADHDNPLEGSVALVDKARALGGAAELAVYPGAAHGFDFHPERRGAREATERALSFLTQQLTD
jgi:acetyl esterase/lipase